MQSDPNLIRLAQQLRRNMTKEESLLWYRFLRMYPLKFRRQHPIGKYIVDFYCHSAKIVVELDGSQHYETPGQARDRVRDQFLQDQGLVVLRYSNLDVLQRFDQVCQHIDDAVRKNAPQREWVE